MAKTSSGCLKLAPAAFCFLRGREGLLAQPSLQFPPQQSQSTSSSFMGKGQEESSHVLRFGLALGTPGTAAGPSGTPSVTAHPPDLLTFSLRPGLEGTIFSPVSLASLSCQGHRHKGSLPAPCWPLSRGAQGGAAALMTPGNSSSRSHLLTMPTQGTPCLNRAALSLWSGSRWQMKTTPDCLIHRENLKMPSFLVPAATSASKVYRRIQ